MAWKDMHRVLLLLFFNTLLLAVTYLTLTFISEDKWCFSLNIKLLCLTAVNIVSIDGKIIYISLLRVWDNLSFSYQELKRVVII